MTKKARLTAILAAALAASSMAVNAVWLDHVGGTAGAIECHGYLYSYSATKYGADTTASSTPYRVSVELTLSDGCADFSCTYNNWSSGEWETNVCGATVTVQGGSSANGGTGRHTVVQGGNAPVETFRGITSH